MRRLPLVLAALAASVLAAHALAADQGQAAKVKPLTAGFYDGRTIRYYDFGSIRLKPGNTLAPIWAVTNGVSGQRNIVDTVPGRADYSPLWQVSMVTWKVVAPRRVSNTGRNGAAVLARPTPIASICTLRKLVWLISGEVCGTENHLTMFVRIIRRLVLILIYSSMSNSPTWMVANSASLMSKRWRQRASW